MDLINVRIFFTLLDLVMTFWLRGKPFIVFVVFVILTAVEEFIKVFRIVAASCKILRIADH